MRFPFTPIVPTLLAAAPVAAAPQTGHQPTADVLSSGIVSQFPEKF